MEYISQYMLVDTFLPVENPAISLVNFKTIMVLTEKIYYNSCSYKEQFQI